MSNNRKNLFNQAPNHKEQSNNVKAVSMARVHRLDGDEYSSNIALGTSSSIGLVFEDLNNTINTNWSVPAVAGTISIVSSDAADNVTGTGIQVAVILGLDENFESVVEPIVMNGTTPVVATNTYKAINNFITFTYGSNGAAEGNITVTNTDDGTEWARMLAGNDSSLLGRYTAPLGFAYHFNIIGWSAPATGDFTLDLVTDIAKPVMTTVSRTFVHQGSGQLTGAPILIREKKTVKLRAFRESGGAGGQRLTAYLGGFIIRNDFAESMFA